jgi:hypothetical protein
LELNILKKIFDNGFLSIILSLIGVIISTFGVFVSLNSKLSGYAVIGLVIINIIFLVATTAGIVIMKYFHEKKEKDLINNNDDLQKNINQKDSEINKLKKEIGEKITQCINLSSERTVHYDSLVGTLNTFLTKVYITELNYNNVYKFLQKNPSDVYYEDKIFDLNEKTYSELKDHTKRFLRLVLDETKGNIEKYLKLKGYDIKVSLAVKQLSKIITPSDTNYRDIFAYTVFRDYETYKNQEEREILGQKFNIYDNSDFAEIIHSQKLKDSIYINNNLQDKSYNHYKNQNKIFLEYYDCTVVVPIGNYDSEDGRILFGFLACDSKKFERYGKIDLFDNICSKIMLTSSRTISAFYSYVYKYSRCWETILCNYNTDFLEKIFNDDLKCS